MTTTSALPLRDALAILVQQDVSPALKSDGTTPILGAQRVYRGTVPPGVVPGYYLIGATPLDEAGYHNGEAGHAGFCRVHCWARTPDDALRLADRLLALTATQPTLTGHDVEIGRWRLSGPNPDTDGAAFQMIADYELSTVAHT